MFDFTDARQIQLNSCSYHVLGHCKLKLPPEDVDFELDLLEEGRVIVVYGHSMFRHS